MLRLATMQMSDPIFTNWTIENTAKWGKEPLKAKHRLHMHPLFSFDALADLITGFPRQHYSLVEVGAQGSSRQTSREGNMGGLRGAAVINAIQNGSTCLSLRNVSHIDKRYRDLIDEAFEEVRRNVPGYETYNRTSGILISSPKAQVPFRADRAGQLHWQIHGKKRVYVYPNTAPFITPEKLENIALGAADAELIYDPAYDTQAAVFEIGGGDMLHWPLNAPHRVQNIDGLNVSITCEYWTENVRRNQMINLANGILRSKTGFRPLSRNTSGPTFWAKAVLQAGVRRAGLLKKQRKPHQLAEFTLDPKTSGAVVDIPIAAE